MFFVRILTDKFLVGGLLLMLNLFYFKQESKCRGSQIYMT